MYETVEGDCLIIRSHHCSAEFLRKMSKFRDDGLYIDVRLKVLDENVECRKENIECQQENLENRPENVENQPENIECRSESVENLNKESEAEKVESGQNIKNEPKYIENQHQNVESINNIENRQQNDEIEAHKLVLSCCSAYFEAMFSHKFSEGGKLKIQRHIR
jgi:hypothetical protein